MTVDLETRHIGSKRAQEGGLPVSFACPLAAQRELGKALPSNRVLADDIDKVERALRVKP